MIEFIRKTIAFYIYQHTKFITNPLPLHFPNRVIQEISLQKPLQFIATTCNYQTHYKLQLQFQLTNPLKFTIAEIIGKYNYQK